MRISIENMILIKEFEWSVKVAKLAHSTQIPAIFIAALTTGLSRYIVKNSWVSAWKPSLEVTIQYICIQYKSSF